jgi:hypothetical protein
VQLTSPPGVADAFMSAVNARTDAPDETYMVATSMSPWWVWPLLIDGCSYFDLADQGRSAHFELNATGLVDSK